MKSFLLIGAGDFGHLLARELSKQPCELMIADINEDALGDLLELGISAKIGDCSREEVLESFDVASFDACFVCVGGHFQTSLEIVYLLEKLHAKKIHCKADDDSQAKFLSIIGADHVIYPEREAAQSLAIVSDTLITHPDHKKIRHLILHHDQGNVPEYYSTQVYISIPTERIDADSVRISINSYDGEVVVKHRCH